MTTSDVTAVHAEIVSLGAEIESEFLRGNILRARFLLGHLHQAVLRAMTYLDDDLSEEVANG
jgi:hypothetical protein